MAGQQPRTVLDQLTMKLDDVHLNQMDHADKYM